MFMQAASETSLQGLGQLSSFVNFTRNINYKITQSSLMKAPIGRSQQKVTTLIKLQVKMGKNDD